MLHRREFLTRTASAVTVAAFGASPASAATATRNFNAYIGGGKVGEQTLSIEQSGANLIVRVDTDVSVNMLVASHKLRQSCVEVWRNGEVQSIKSNSIENGKKLRTDATRTANGLKIEGAKYSGTRKGNVATTTFFMPELVTRNVWISTQPGKPIKVKTSRGGTESFRTDAGTFNCQKFKCRGNLKAPIDVYYTSDGELAGYVARRFGLSLRTVATSLSPKFSTLW